MISSKHFRWDGNHVPAIRHKAGEQPQIVSTSPYFDARTRAASRLLDRIPVEDVSRAVELVER
jgi:hypothetical protein